MTFPPQLDFWHPVALSRQLRRRPLSVRLLDTPLVVFRTSRGVGALHDVCPHRGMRLSAGKVTGGRLQCPYHGYTFDGQGCGRSPATPRRSIQAPALDALERCGAIWVKRRDSHATMPQWTRRLDIDITLSATVGAPLELVMDNFSEVEHTPTTHAFLGYRQQDMPHVTTELKLTEDTVRVVNIGPQKPMPAIVRRLIGFSPGDPFVDDWTTWFEPPHAVYDHYWLNPGTGEPRADRLITAVHFNPVDARTTQVMSFTTAHGPRSANVFWRLALRPAMRAIVGLEVARDQAMLERLADHGTELKGRKLSRFDKPLAENRKRLNAKYFRVASEDASRNS